MDVLCASSTVMWMSPLVTTNLLNLQYGISFLLAKCFHCKKLFCRKRISDAVLSLSIESLDNKGDITQDNYYPHIFLSKRHGIWNGI